MSFEQRITSDTNLNELIARNYKTEMFNTASLEKADIICIGECHESDKHRRQQAQIIDHFYQEHCDRVLLEAPSTYKNLPPLKTTQIEYTQNVKNAYGWDIPDRDRSLSLRAFEHLKQLKWRQGQALLLLVAGVALPIMRSIITDNPIAKSVVGSIALTVCLVSAYIFKKQADKRKSLLREINEYSQSRNQWMCREITTHSELCRGKIFVLAGRHHFPGGAKKEDGDDCELVEKSVRCIRNCLGNKKAVILIPKSDD